MVYLLFCLGEPTINQLLIFVRIETTKVYMNDREIIDMTKKLPHGHNIGGGNNQKRRQEFKKNKSD